MTWGSQLDNPDKVTRPMAALWSLVFQTLHPKGQQHPSNTAARPAVARKQVEKEEAGPQLSPATRFSGRCHHGGCNAKWNQIRTDRSPARVALQASSSSASLVLPFLSAGTRTHHFAHVCCGVSPAAGPAKPEQTSNLSTRSESGQEGGCLPTAPRAPER